MSPLQWVADRLRDDFDGETGVTAGLVYECRGCHRRYELEYYICPACKSFCVEPCNHRYLDSDNPFYR